MFDWISQHQKVLSVMISFGTLLIWLVYAQLLYQSYRRQRRPRIVINRGKHRSVNALCLISNMSAESVFVEHIVAWLETDRGVLRADVTELEQDYEQGDEDRQQRHGTAPDSLRDSTRQGPLAPGEFLHIGAFGDVIERVCRARGVSLEAGDGDERIVRARALTVQVVAIYGSDDLPIGVERRFLIHETKRGHLLVPDTWDSKRLASRRQRRRLRDLMEELRKEQLAGD
ncbi:hypothetical protein [Alloalcanivorax marinus]|uniref:hypothetical protein n=1 Tax=Alloalcanivorax marinus TaxID=1177169 RepID=UPI001933D952|nr:hypothetical protein [Alloalcanivorax marinus]MBL7251612.1 hypothetical protein [Alloalcanivorax marinus]